MSNPADGAVDIFPAVCCGVSAVNAALCWRGTCGVGSNRRVIFSTPRADVKNWDVADVLLVFFPCVVAGG